MAYDVKTMPLTAKSKLYEHQGMIFQGKIDWWFYGIMILIAVILIPFIVMAFIDGMNGAAVVDLLVLAVIEGFCGLIVRRNYVRMESCGLTVVFGLIQLSVCYSDVTALSETRNMVSSLAASSDRIEIRYGKNGCVMIAVVEKQAFIAEMKKRCPDCTIGG